MPIGNLPGDGKAKAASVLILLGLFFIKAAEDVGDILRQYPASPICEGKDAADILIIHG